MANRTKRNSGLVIPSASELRSFIKPLPAQQEFLDAFDNRVDALEGWATSSPSGMNWLYELGDDPQALLINAHTKENVSLPDGYVSSLLSNGMHSGKAFVDALWIARICT